MYMKRLKEIEEFLIQVDEFFLDSVQVKNFEQRLETYKRLEQFRNLCRKQRKDPSFYDNCMKAIILINEREQILDTLKMIENSEIDPTERGTTIV